MRPVSVARAPATDALRPASQRALPRVRPLERRRLQCYLALILADIAALFASFWISGYLYLGPQGPAMTLLLAHLILPVFLTIGLYNGAYSADALAMAPHGIAKALTALALSAAAVVFIAFYTKSSAEFSRVAFSCGVLAAILALGWSRLIMRRFVAWRCGRVVINELLIDDGGPAVSLPGVRRVVLAEYGLAPALDDPQSLHRVGALLDAVDRVVITCPPERRETWAIILKGANVAGELLDDSVARLGALGARIGGGHGWLRVSIGPLGLRARVFKRLFDIAVAALGLVLLSPLFLVVMLAIRIEDGGPALFVQRRVGRGNRFFAMYKFRSMRASNSDRAGLRSVTRGDPRITRIGKIIRATSIDELPQLVNVLLGEMSVVGPRPHALGSQAGEKLFWEVDLRYWQRHALKPGLTGLAQVRGLRGATDHEADLESRLNADLEYVDRWSLWGDIVIVLSTLRILIHDRAY